MAQKFIITNGGHLRFGNVNMHRDLLLPGEDCLGGGLYEFDYTSGHMLLSGRSYDYGSPAWRLIDRVIIPQSLSGLAITYDDVPLSALAEVVYQ